MILAKEVAQRWEEWLFRLYKDDNEQDYLAEQDDIFKSMVEAHTALSASHGTISPTVLDYFKLEYDRQKDGDGRLGFLAFKQIVLHIKKETEKIAAAHATANTKLKESGKGKARAVSSTSSQYTLQQDELGSPYSGYTPMRRSGRIHANLEARRCVSGVQHMQTEVTSHHRSMLKATPIPKMPKIDPPRKDLKRARAASTPIVHKPAIESRAVVKNVDIPRMGHPRKTLKVEVVIPWTQSGHRFVKSLPKQKRHYTEDNAITDEPVDHPATPLKTDGEQDNNGVLQFDAAEEDKSLADVDQFLKNIISPLQYENDIKAKLDQLIAKFDETSAKVDEASTKFNEIIAKLDEMIAKFHTKLPAPSNVHVKAQQDDKSSIKFEVSSEAKFEEEEFDEAPGGKRKLKLEVDDVVDAEFYSSRKKAKDL